MDCQKKRTVILYPGSFNPIHIGHTALASYTISNIRTDELWFIPSPQNPNKSLEDILPLNKRVDIIEKSIVEEERFSVCNIEQNLASPYYSIRTLRALGAIYPNTKFYLLIGADSLKSIDKWYNGNSIIGKYDIIVYPRVGYDISNFIDHDNITILNNAPYIAISSTMIRQAKKEGKVLKYYLPKAELWDII